MSRHLRRLSVPCLVALASCASHNGDTTGSIGELRHTSADLTDVKIAGSTDLAIQSYREFLERTPEGGMTPEALRRLADLKVQKEYGTLEGVKRNQEKAARREASSTPTDSALGIAAVTPAVAAAAATTEPSKPAEQKAASENEPSALSLRKGPDDGRYLLQVDRQTKGSYHSLEDAQALRCFDVANNTDNLHRRRFEDSHGLHDFLLALRAHAARWS